MFGLKNEKLILLMHVVVLFIYKQTDSMRGSRNFHQGGGGPGQSDKKALTTFFFFIFLVLSLFYRSQIVNFREIYHFSRFQRGSNIFKRGSNFFQGGGGGGGGGPITFSL